MTEILTTRLRLRRFTDDDLQTYHRVIYGSPAVMLTLPGGAPRPLEAVEWMLGWHNRHWAEHGCGFFAVELRDTGEFIGHVGVFIWGLDGFELGYAYGEPHWGKGYATEAGHACLRHAFETIDMDRIDAVTAPQNFASQGVLRNLGFKDSGERRAYDAMLPYFTLAQADYHYPADALYKLTPVSVEN